MTSPMHPIAPGAVRYIKLGPGGRWARACFEAREMQFGAPDEPHDLCLAGDWDGARAVLSQRMRTPGAASDTLRELREFYTQGEDCLWITFADGHLWWAFAELGVVDLRERPGEHGAVMRRVRGWLSTGIMGQPLAMDMLSTRLTKVAAYQRTICSVEDADYLVRRINGVDEPTVAAARQAGDAMVAATRALIERLHWSDFEVLVDLLFQRSGWQRVSRLGGDLKDADLIVEQPATGERALVQVKSRADGATLARYEAVYRAGGYDRLFFICHSPEGGLVPGELTGVHVWTGDELARRAVAAGLVDWLMGRSA